MDDFAIAIVLAAVFSILICITEVMFYSKVGFKACVNGSAILYLLILLVGNAATTLVAATTTTEFFAGTATNAGFNLVETSPEGTPTRNDQPIKDDISAAEIESFTNNSNLVSSGTTDKPQGTEPLRLRFPGFWYAFLGVFGFKVLLQNINVTFFGKGVLSINDWIYKARDNAVASAIESQTNADSLRSQKLANRLKELSDDTLRAHVINALGTIRLQELEATAQSAGADARLTMALVLAHEAYDTARAIQI